MLSVWVPADIIDEVLEPSAYDEDFIKSIRHEKTQYPKQLSLGQHALVNKGSTPLWQGDSYLQSGIPFIRSGQVGDLSFDENGMVHIAPAVHSRMRSSEVQSGDVLLNIVGASIGRCALVPRKFCSANINQAISRIRPFGELNSGFLAAYLASFYGQLKIKRAQSGVARDNLDLYQVRQIRVPLVNYQIQQAIGNKLRKAERLRELAAASRDLAERQINAAYGSLPNENGFPQHGWHSEANIETLRIDPWFHRPFYVAMAERLSGVDGLKPVDSVCKLVTTSAKLGAWKQETFDYFEIGGVNSAVGEATAFSTAVSDAPSRAKYLVRAGDILVSTVRPNLKAVGQIDPDRSSPGVATSGFCVLRPPTPELGAYVRACLVHDAGVHQLMRWNTGGIYPAIDHDVPGRVLIPFEQESATEVGGRLLQALRNNREAGRLIDLARAAVEALIDGTLDEPALLAEGEAIEQWLAENPSPHDTEKP